MYINLAKSYKHFKRYREIAQILLKNGFGFLLEILDLKKYLPFKKRFKSHDKKLNRKNMAKRLRIVLEELGPTFIKLGQILSTRTDIIPPIFIEELSKLQDEVESLEFEIIEKVLNEELDGDYKNYFISVNKNPQATASIAQTHKAKMKNGKNVILKIQRPGLEKKINTDLEIIENMINVLNKRNIFPSYIDLNKLLEEFNENINKEMDFKRELSNIKKFKNNFANNSHIISPEVFENLSTKKLLVMGEIKGVKLSNVDKMTDEIDASYIAELGAWSLFKQILIDGFFHGDPHPGNIFVVDSDKIAYVDFGLMGHISRSDQDLLTTMFIAVLIRNEEIIADKILEMGVIHKNISRRKLILEIEDLLNRYYSRTLDELDISSIAEDLQRLIFKFHIKMPQEFLVLMRSLAVSEGVGTSIDPNFNIFKMKDRFLKDIISDRLKVTNMANRFFSKFWRIKTLSRDLPEDLRSLLEKLANDKFSIKFEHENLEPLIKKLDIVSNRLSVSLIVSALLIGSSMVLQSDIGPQIFSIPLLGFLGYTSAGVLGLWLVITIFKSGKF